MVEQEVAVVNKIGFHARPASLLIHTAQNYKSVVYITKNGQQIVLGSLISLMKLRVKFGDVVTIKAEGPDEAEALKNLVTLIENKFGESE
ncbi:MAG: HPr family phosphocarrier protein [Treponema sp.]|nr:HPr family phosphocarrier protein [Treponema sp.]